MADLQLSIKVVAADGSERTVQIASGQSMAVRPGDRLILFGQDAARAKLVRAGDDLSVVIDDQVVFTIDDYYTLEGPQAAEVITDPAVAATYLTAAEGGLPLLTTPPAETAGPAPLETQAPQVDLVQATSPVLPGDNASVKSWKSDGDIVLDDPTYRPLEIEYYVEEELIPVGGPIPGPTPPGPEPVNLPPYFTTVVFDEDGNPSADPSSPVDEYNFQMYEYVEAYRALPNTFAHPPHYWEWTGADPAGTTYWTGWWQGGGFPGSDQLTLNGGFNSEISVGFGQFPPMYFMFAKGWGYIPEDELGWIGVVDPEGDPITVEWANQTLSGHATTWWGDEWDFQLSEELWDKTFGGHDGFGNYLLPWQAALQGDGVLELLVDTTADPAWENVFQVWSSMIVGGEYQYPGYYEYDGPDGVAEAFGPTGHFSTTLYAWDPYHAPVSVPVNFDILDVNEAPEFDQWFYYFNPWEANDNNGKEFLVDLAPPTLGDEVVLNDFPDYELPEGYTLFVGNVHAVDPDFLDQAEYGGQVLYSFMHNLYEQGGDPDWVPYLEWVGDMGDTAGWRAESLSQFSEDGVLWINETTGDIWADESYWDLNPYELTWDSVPQGYWWDNTPTNHTYGGPKLWYFSDDDSSVLASAWTEGDTPYFPVWPTGYYNGFYGEWTPGDGYERGNLAYTEYEGKSGLLVEGKGPESAVDEIDANEWLVLNFERPVLLQDMNLQLFYDKFDGKVWHDTDLEWGKYAITSAATGETFEVRIEADSCNGDFYYEFEHTGYVTSIAFQAGDWMEQYGDWASDYLLHSISYEQLPDTLDPALVYAHDGVDRYGEVYDGDGNLVYDEDRIYSDLWDVAGVMLADPPIPEDHPILNDQTHFTPESMMTAAPVKEGCNDYEIYDGTLADPKFWIGDLTDLDGDNVTYAIIGGDPNMVWDIIYEDGKAYIVAADNSAEALNYEGQNHWTLTVQTYEDGLAYDTGEIDIYLTNVNESPWLDHFHLNKDGTQDIYDNPVEPYDYASTHGGEPQDLFEHRDAVVHVHEHNASLLGYLGDFDSKDYDLAWPPPEDAFHYSLTGSENQSDPDNHFWALTHGEANKYFDIGEHTGWLSLDFDWGEFEWEIDDLVRGTYEFRVLVHDQGIDGPEYYDSALVQFEVANHNPDRPDFDPIYESMQTGDDYLRGYYNTTNFAESPVQEDPAIMSDGSVYLGSTYDFDGDRVYFTSLDGEWHVDYRNWDGGIGDWTEAWLVFDDIPNLNYEVQNLYFVDVGWQEWDNGILIDSGTWYDLRIDVMNVNEAPTLTDVVDTTVDVSAAVGTDILDVGVTDPDADDQAPGVHYFQLIATADAVNPGDFDPNDWLEIDQDGLITVKSDLSTLEAGDYYFWVAVNDDGGPVAIHDLADADMVKLTITDNLHAVQYNGRANTLTDEGERSELQASALTMDLEEQHDGNGVGSGWSVTNLGDINGDGIDDFAIGAPYANTVGGGEYEPSDELHDFAILGNQVADDFYIADYMFNSTGGSIGLTIDAEYTFQQSPWADTDVHASWHYETGDAHGVAVISPYDNQWYIDRSNQLEEKLTFEFTEDVTLTGVELIDVWNSQEQARLDFYDDGTMTHYMTVVISGSGGTRYANVTLTDVIGGTSSAYTETVGESGPHLYALPFSVTTDYIEATGVTNGDHYAVGGFIGGYDPSGYTYHNGETYVVFGDPTWDYTDPSTLPLELARPVHLDSGGYDLGGSPTSEPVQAGFVIHGETGEGHDNDYSGWSVANAGNINGDFIVTDAFDIQFEDIGGVQTFHVTAGTYGQDLKDQVHDWWASHSAQIIDGTSDQDVLQALMDGSRQLNDVFIGAPGVDRVVENPDVWVENWYNSFASHDNDIYEETTGPDRYFIPDYIGDVDVEIRGFEENSTWAEVGVAKDYDAGGTEVSFGVEGERGPDDQLDGRYDEYMEFIFSGPVTLSGFKLTDMDWNDDGYAKLYNGSTLVGTVEIDGQALTITPDETAEVYFTATEVTKVEFWTDGANLDDFSVAGFHHGQWVDGGTEVIHDVGAAYVVFGNADPWAADFYLDDIDGTNGIKIIGDEAGEASGWSVHTAFDFNGDGYDDLLIGAPKEDGSLAPDRGEAYIVWGQEDWTANDGVVDLDTLGSGGFKIGNVGQWNDDEEAGFSVGFLGDLNNDGSTEVVIGVPGDHLVGTGDGDAPGAAYVLVSDAAYYESHTGEGLWNLWEDQGRAIRIVGEHDGDLAGYSVSSAGDIDGDGLDDLIIGAPGYDHVEPDVFYEGYFGFAGAPYTEDSTDQDLDFAGYMPTKDGSGWVGVSVSGEEYRSGWNDRWVTYNSGALGIDGTRGPDGEIDGYRDERMTFTFDEEVTVSGFKLGDVDNNDDGVAYLYDDAHNLLHTVNIQAGVDEYHFDQYDVKEVVFETDGDTFDNYSVAGFYGGYTEEGETHEDAGAAYVVYGSTIAGVIGDDNPTIQLADLDGTNGFKIVGDDAGDELGTSVSGAGDVNGDGLDDVIVGAPGDDDDTGEAVIIFGEDGGVDTGGDGVIEVSDILTDPETGVILEGQDEGDRFGESVSGAGDVNGDAEDGGGDDVVVGAPGADGDAGEGQEGGETYLVFGGPEMTAADVLEVEDLVQAA